MTPDNWMWNNVWLALAVHHPKSCQLYTQPRRLLSREYRTGHPSTFTQESSAGGAEPMCGRVVAVSSKPPSQSAWWGSSGWSGSLHSWTLHVFCQQKQITLNVALLTPLFDSVDFSGTPSTILYCREICMTKLYLFSLFEDSWSLPPQIVQLHQLITLASTWYFTSMSFLNS